MNERFNVVQFFMDGQYEYVARGLTVEQALLRAKAVIQSVGGRLGTTQRVILTDGGDETVFEWIHGIGIVFPEGFEYAH